MIKKFFLVTFSLLILLNAFSQEKDLKELSIGLKFYPGVSDTYGGKFFDERNHYYIPRLSINGGIEILKEIRNKTMYFETGILVINRGFNENVEIKRYKRLTGFTNIDSIAESIAIGDSQTWTETHSIIETHYYLTIPFSIILKKDWFYYGGGLNFGYFLKRNRFVDKKLTDTDWPLYSGDADEYNFFKYFMIGFQLKAGLMKKINEKLSFRSELYTSATISPTFLNYGIGLGLDYKIK